MTLYEIFILCIIVLISLDTTIFLQSLLSQPIFSCQIIGGLLGNYEIGLLMGVLSQLIFLSYTPVGGAKIPDVQLAPNILLLHLSDHTVSVELLGRIIPLLIIASAFFLSIILLERYSATSYMQKTEYVDIQLKKIIYLSFIRHFIFFFIGSILFYYFLDNFTTTYLELDLFSGKNLFYFTVFFAFGNLLLKYLKRGFFFK